MLGAGHRSLHEAIGGKSRPAAFSPAGRGALVRRMGSLRPARTAGGSNVVCQYPKTLCQHDAFRLGQASRQGRAHQEQLGRDREAIVVMALDFGVPTERARTAGHIVVFALSLKFCGCSIQSAEMHGSGSRQMAMLMTRRG